MRPCKRIAVALAGAVIINSPAALAGEPGWARPPPVAAARVYFDYAQVLHVRPVYESSADSTGPQCQAASAAPAQCGDVRSQTRGGLAEAIRMELPEPAVCALPTRSARRPERYEVTYRYRGRTYTRMMSYDPGASVRVRVQMSAS